MTHLVRRSGPRYVQMVDDVSPALLTGCGLMLVGFLCVLLFSLVQLVAFALEFVRHFHGS